MGVRRVALGGDILGSRRNPRSITATITTAAPAPATTKPTLHQQLNLQLQLQLQLQRRTTSIDSTPDETTTNNNQW